MQAGINKFASVLDKLECMWQMFSQPWYI